MSADGAPSAGAYMRNNVYNNGFCQVRGAVRKGSQRAFPKERIDTSATVSTSLSTTLPRDVLAQGACPGFFSATGCHF